MRVLQINSVCGIRSTGRIAIEIAEKYMAEGHECKIAYGREVVPKEYQSYSYRIGTDIGVYINTLKARFWDNEGFNAKKSTKTFLRWADEYNPDLLWLHNLHGYYINVELLFDWIKSRPQMQVRWTLHDCWGFTGHCSYFSFVKCEKWKNMCEGCCQKSAYPTSFLMDFSKRNYVRKKQVFTEVAQMELITPSKWLSDLVKQSFLKDYPIMVEHNRINLDVFRPTESEFRKKNNLVNKKIVLGVATTWAARKGLDDFIELSQLLDDSYQIVLVGINKKQLKRIPSNILCLQRTNNIDELVEIYSAADIYVNPSKEETFGLTTVEALACGTPAIVYKDTACEEVVNKYGGIAVGQTVTDIFKAIYDMEEND